MARWISKPKRTVKVQIVGGSLERRLAKVERELTQIESEQRLLDCICNKPVILSGARSVAHFRAEMNRTCPSHGFRRLNIMRLVLVRPADDGPKIVEEPAVEEVLNEYKRRLAEAKQRDEDD
jgi:hypothetical protein